MEVGHAYKAIFSFHLIAHSLCVKSHVSHDFHFTSALAGTLFLGHFYPQFTDEDTIDSES